MNRQPKWTALRAATAAGLFVASATWAPTPAKADGVKKQRYVKAVRTVPVDPAKVKEGETLYGQCAGCHGMKAEGRVGIAPSLASKSFLEAADDPTLIQTIRKGRAGTTMIPWEASLRIEQVMSIVAYLRSLQPTEPAMLDEAPNHGDQAKGEKVFRSICATCHGRNGAGYQESSSGSGIGRKAFLDVVSDGYLRHIVNKGKSGTAMRAFGGKAATAVANLSEQEIEDVIAYMRANAW